MVLNGLAQDAGQPTETLPLLDPAEAMRQRDVFNATDADFPRDALIQDLVAQRAAAQPQAIAVTDDKRQLGTSINCLFQTFP